MRHICSLIRHVRLGLLHHITQNWTSKPFYLSRAYLNFVPLSYDVFLLIIANIVSYTVSEILVF